MNVLRKILGGLLLASAAGGTAAAETTPVFPILVPLTGALALEGTSQGNGARLAVEEAAARAADKEHAVRPLVLDTGSNPQTAVQAFARALGGSERPSAAIGPIDGNSMLALLPLAAEAKLPLLMMSGTTRLTELGNAWVFRFFPSDAAVKAAQARYAVEELKRGKVALIHQTTAYGQSGNEQLTLWIEKLGGKVVYRNSVPVTTREMSGIVAQIRDAGADIVILQLHAGSTALFVQQAARAGLGLPIVAGSAMHQPSTAALLEPAELKGVCAETASAPAADEAAPLRAFAERYRARFKAEPDAFALAAYDAATIALAHSRDGRAPGEALRTALATGTFAGLAMTYKSDGTGNMAHDAVIVCYDGASRVPRIVKRYTRPQG